MIEGRRENIPKMPEGNEVPFKKALVIDDVYLEDFNRGLDALGISHSSASWMTAAMGLIEKAKPGDYDVVFLDHNMPIAESGRAEDIGYTLLPLIREKLPSAFVIGTSSIYHEVTPKSLKQKFLGTPDHNIQKITELQINPSEYLRKVFGAINKKGDLLTN